MYKYILLLLMISCSLNTKAQSQVAPHEQQIIGLSASVAASKYNEHFGTMNTHINGKEYTPYYVMRRSSPLLEGEYGKADLYSNGRKFSNVHIAYDMNLDIFVTIPNVGKLVGSLISLNSLIIDSCSIVFHKNKHTLHYLKLQQTDKYLNNGFYEYVSNKKYPIIIKHTIQENELNGRIDYIYKPLYFIKIDGKYQRLKSKKKFLKLFPFYRKAIKKHIRGYNITFRSFGKYELAELIKYVERLHVTP